MRIFGRAMSNFDSAILTNEISNGESLWKKTSSIVSASSENLSAEQKSSLNQMIGNINEIVGGRTLEEFKFNETAVEQMAGIVKNNFKIYNTFVINMFNLTENDLGMTRNQFCQEVPDICNRAYNVPSEFEIPSTA